MTESNDPHDSDSDKDSEDEPGGREDGQGVGPAEDLEEDPAYNPEGPEKGYKGG